MGFLRERIRLKQRAKGVVKKEVHSTERNIYSLSRGRSGGTRQHIRSNTQRVFNTTKDRQQRKFEKPLREKQDSVSPTTSFVDKTNWVVNLSSRSLTEAEVSKLKKGLNFAVTPADIPEQPRLSPRLNQPSDNSTRNEYTQ